MTYNIIRKSEWDEDGIDSSIEVADIVTHKYILVRTPDFDDDENDCDDDCEDEVTEVATLDIHLICLASAIDEDQSEYFDDISSDLGEFYIKICEPIIDSGEAYDGGHIALISSLQVMPQFRGEKLGLKLLNGVINITKSEFPQSLDVYLKPFPMNLDKTLTDIQRNHAIEIGTAALINYYATAGFEEYDNIYQLLRL